MSKSGSSLLLSTESASTSALPALRSSPSPSRSPSRSPSEPSSTSLPGSESDYLPQPSSFSKREYLLAQIRQKDSIIESLLRQVSLIPAFLRGSSID